MLFRLAAALLAGLLMMRPRLPLEAVTAGPDDLPPTPPPGYEGAWPPGSGDPDVPPTPPPGYEGEWPPPQWRPPVLAWPRIVPFGSFDGYEAGALAGTLLGARLAGETREPDAPPHVPPERA